MHLIIQGKFQVLIRKHVKLSEVRAIPGFHDFVPFQIRAALDRRPACSSREVSPTTESKGGIQQHLVGLSYQRTITEAARRRAQKQQNHMKAKKYLNSNEYNINGSQSQLAENLGGTVDASGNNRDQGQTPPLNAPGVQGGSQFTPVNGQDYPQV